MSATKSFAAGEIDAWRRRELLAGGGAQPVDDVAPGAVATGDGLDVGLSVVSIGVGRGGSGDMELDESDFVLEDVLDVCRRRSSCCTGD